MFVNDLEDENDLVWSRRLNIRTKRVQRDVAMIPAAHIPASYAQSLPDFKAKSAGPSVEYTMCVIVRPTTPVQFKNLRSKMMDS